MLCNLRQVTWPLWALYFPISYWVLRSALDMSHQKNTVWCQAWPHPWGGCFDFNLEQVSGVLFPGNTTVWGAGKQIGTSAEEDKVFAIAIVWRLIKEGGWRDAISQLKYQPVYLWQWLSLGRGAEATGQSITMPPALQEGWEAPPTHAWWPGVDEPHRESDEW